MINQSTKNEIGTFFEKYKVTIDKSITQDTDFLFLFENLKEATAFEKPDAFCSTEKCMYGIEHFQVSQYTVKQNQDLSRVAKGSQENRNKMKQDRDFDLNPKLENLVCSINRLLESHSKSFNEYKHNLCQFDKEKDYKLIIFVEDSTESAYIVKKRSSDTTPINPLDLDEIAEIFLSYCDEVYGVIYSYGNEQSKLLTGCTLAELRTRKERKKLLDINFYNSFEVKKSQHIAKSPDDDETKVTIKLYDRI